MGGQAGQLTAAVPAHPHLTSPAPHPALPSLAPQYDRRLLTAYLDALIHQGLCQEQPGAEGQPAAPLELAPGVHLPPPDDYASMTAAIDSFPPDAPALYSMHANAQLSLLGGQTDALFTTLLVRRRGGKGRGGMIGAGNMVGRQPPAPTLSPL